MDRVCDTHGNTRRNWDQDTQKMVCSKCILCSFGNWIFTDLYQLFPYWITWDIRLWISTRYYVQGVNMRCLFVIIIFQSHQDFIKERAAQNPSGGPTITQCHMVNKDLKLRNQSLPSPQSALPWDIYINLCSAYCEETREPHYIYFFI